MIRELNYTITGNPTISDNFILTKANTNNNIVTNQVIDFSKPFKFNFQITASYSYFSNYMMYSENTSFMLYTGSRRNLYICSGSTSNRLLTITTSSSNGMDGEVELTWTGTTLTGTYTPASGGDPVTASREQTTAPFENGKIIVGRYGTTASSDEPSYDLKKFVIEYTDGTSFKLVNEFEADIYYKLDHVLETKRLIKNALIDKGVEVTDDDPFREYANKIIEIPAGGNYAISCTNYGNQCVILDNHYSVSSVGVNSFIGTSEDISDYPDATSFEICHTFIANQQVDTWHYLGSFCPKDISQMSGDYNGITYEYGTSGMLKCLISFTGYQWDYEFTTSEAFVIGHKYCFKINFNVESGYDFELKDVSENRITYTHHLDNTNLPYNQNWSSGVCFGLSSPYDFPNHNSTCIHVLNETYFKYTVNGEEKTYVFAKGSIPHVSRNPVLTGDETTIDGKVYRASASRYVDSNYPYVAFDGDTSTGDRCWWTGINEVYPMWLMYEYPEPVTVFGVSLMNETTSPEFYSYCQVQVSNNGVDFIDVQGGRITNDYGYGSTLTKYFDKMYQCKYVRFLFPESPRVSIQEATIYTFD